MKSFILFAIAEVATMFVLRFPEWELEFKICSFLGCTIVYIASAYISLLFKNMKQIRKNEELNRTIENLDDIRQRLSNEINAKNSKISYLYEVLNSIGGRIKANGDETARNTLIEIKQVYFAHTEREKNKYE